MKKLMFATALVASAAAFADPTALNAISFEGYSADATFANGTAEKGEDGNDKSPGPFFYYDGDADGSSVKTFATGDAGAMNAPTRPFYFQGVSPALNYLELSTEGGTLWRSINPISSTTVGEETTYGLGTAQAVAATGTYLDTLVQFTPTEEGGAPELTTDDKLAIWLDSSNNTTNLMVRANLYDFGESPSWTPTTFTLAAAEGSKTVVAGQWYRLTVKAIPNVLLNDDNGGIPAFEIYVDGVQMCATTAQFTSAMVTTLTGMDALSEDMTAAIAANKIFPSLAEMGAQGATPTLQGVGFKGSGALDDIVWTEEDPFQAPALAFTLTWPAGLTAVSYAIGNGEAVAISGSSPFSVPGIASGDVISFIVANADGAQKTLTGTVGTDEGIDATGTTFGWPEYLGAAVDGAYEIDNLAELKLFQKGIATTTNELKLATAGETFKLTADIALDAAWPGVGVQNGKDIYSTADFNAAAFQGTFDGQNHTISGFQMVGGGLDYCGFFNSTYGATIQNLKIAYAGGLFAADTAVEPASNESGATFVGVAKNSTLRNLTTVDGTVSCYKGFGGIVGYLTSGTLVDSCTNNVNMTSLKPNKCGGIAMITQGGSAVTICNCQNNGTIAGSSETGSIVGYIGLNTTIENCESTVAYKLMHRQSGTVTVQGTNKGLASVLAYSNATNLPIDGLAFATVDGNNVATFVKVADFAMGNTYKVTGTAAIETTPTYRPGAIATFNFTAAGTIAFDTSLAVPTWNVTADEGLDLTFEDANNVRTYTAAAQGGDDYEVVIDGSDVVITPQPEDFAAIEPFLPAGVTTNDVAAVNALLATPIEGTTIPAWQAMFLGVEPTTNGLKQVAIKSVSFDAEGKVVVEMADGVTLKTGRGVNINLILKASDDLSTWTTLQTATDSKAFTPVTPALGETKKFYKVVVEFAGSSN